MIGFLRSAWLIFVELSIILFPLLIIALVVARRANPALEAHLAWGRRRKELEAEVVRLSYVEGGFEALIAAQGELAAHDVLEPEVPWWARRLVKGLALRPGSAPRR